MIFPTGPTLLPIVFSRSPIVFHDWASFSTRSCGVKIQRTGYLTAFKRKIFPGIRYTWEEKTGNVLEEILKLNIENHDEGSEVSNFPSDYFFGDRLVSPKKGALSTLGLKAKRIW